MERHNRRFSISFHLLLLPLPLSSSSSSSSKLHKPSFPQILLQNPISNSLNPPAIPLLTSSSPLTRRTSVFWSSNDWKKKLSSFINFFQSI
uniref:Uncharacterized protein n=1 Tax=Cucumis melo TaxID=3656 RepID=A0A9I9E806_CUCME